MSKPFEDILDSVETPSITTEKYKDAIDTAISNFILYKEILASKEGYDRGYADCLDVVKQCFVEFLELKLTCKAKGAALEDVVIIKE